MSALEYLHKTLLERGHEDLLFYIEQAVQQRDRLLWGVNERSSELESLKREHALLRERYRLLDQKHTQLHAINAQHLEELRRLKENGQEI